MRRAGLPVAHQGHLVQIPCHQVVDAVAQGTDVITVFTLDKAAGSFCGSGGGRTCAVCAAQSL